MFDNSLHGVTLEGKGDRHETRFTVGKGEMGWNSGDDLGSESLILLALDTVGWIIEERRVMMVSTRIGAWGTVLYCIGCREGEGEVDHEQDLKG
jgi:hypothetical protein